MVTGLGRTGTSILHELLTLEGDNRVPLQWEMMYPVPGPETATFMTDERIAKADREIRARDPQIRAQGLYALHSQEASAFNMYIEPRQQYPQFTLPVMPQPVGYSWGMPSPDFLSYIAFVDGAKTYRIHGKRKNNYWSTLQLFSSFWGEGKVGVLGHVDFDDIPTAADGSFEIYLGPGLEPEGDRYWVKFDPDARNIQLYAVDVYLDSL